MGPDFKVFIKSYGCQMNVYDSKRMADFFVSRGCVLVSSYEDANLVILNTCEIREKAEEKLFSDLGRIKQFRLQANERGNDYLVAVSGCVAQLRKADIAKRSGCVDIILGPQMVHEIYNCVCKLCEIPFAEREPITMTEFKSDEKFKKFSAVSVHEVSAFVTIQEGCDNFCSYCIVPHTRGREFSRPVEDIIEEIKSLVSLGVKEVTLLGQNVNSYRGTKKDGSVCSLADLIRTIYCFCDLKLLRFGTSNPHDMCDDLISAFNEVPILMPFLHLPIQSGSDVILEQMNRKYTVSQYKDIICKLKDARSDIAFSSDFIVGFPGETEEDFKQTLDIVNYVSYAQSYSFKYSPRPYTKAAGMLNQIPEKIKEERLAILQDLINKKQKNFNDQTIGKILDVLLVKEGKHDKQLVGRTPYHQAIAIDCADTNKIGDIVKVKVVQSVSHSLIGTLANDD